MLRQSLVKCLICDKTMKKMLTLKFDKDKYALLENKTQQILKTNKTNCYICKAATYNSNQDVHVCVATQMCRKIYLKCTTNKIMTSQVLLYHNA